MRRLLVWIGFGLGSLIPAMAQTSLQALEQDLTAIKEQHDQASSQVLTTFLSTLDAASQSGGLALDLYKRAGGNLPDLSPVRKHYEYETPTEKAQRDAIDAQNFASVAIVVQIHCGLMHNAALLVLKPKDADVHDQWITWLKTMAAVYPQLAGSRALKDVSMRNSVISSYLKFQGWGNSEPGGWAIRDMPRLYHDLVLQPLRKPPGPGTLDAWDTYTAMMQADDSDHDHWTNVVEPELDFNRTADDFAIEPTMEKLATLDQLIKANPSSEHLDEWINRTRDMIAVYRTSGGNLASSNGQNAVPGPTPGTPSSGTSGTTPGATPGTVPAGTTSAVPGPTPGTVPVGSSTALPAATPGTVPSGSNGTVPAATPGTVPAGTSSAVPTATPGVTPSGTRSTTPTATPGTPVSGTGAPTPTATP